MYIPKPALEDCLTSEISASGGDLMYDYITGSQIRRVHYFGNTTGSHEFEIYQGCTDSTQLLLVGGGGAGGYGEKRTAGSGGPYFLGPPSSFIGCLNTATQTAGGGGAGGGLFINPNRELTGSLALVPGKYPIFVGDGGDISGSEGENTTFKYAFQLANDADLPSGSISSSRYDYDSQFIKAGGGGNGGIVDWSVTLDGNCGITAGTPHWFQNAGDGGDGGSGGGAANTFCGDGGLYIGDSGSVDFPFRNQGHEGIWYYTPGVDGVTTNKGNGGGGMLSISGSEPTDAQTVGGLGRFFAARGYNQDYGFGGNAQGEDDCGTADLVEPGDARDLFQSEYDSGSQMPYYKGSGGQAFVQDFTSSMTETFQQDYFKGVAGEAIITYALTGSQLQNGKLTYIDGGVSGGIFTFIPCGEVRVETLVVPAGKQACICAMDTGQGLYRGGTYNDYWFDNVDLQNVTQSDYLWEPQKMLDQMPSGSGTVTFTTGSECRAYVPFEGWENCGPCKESAPAGIYIGVDITGSSGRTNPLPYYKYPDTNINYTSSQNYITSSRYNNHDSESYFQTRVAAISNDFDDDVPFSTFPPSASFNTNYSDQSVDFTTGSNCFTYYDCDPLAFNPITASGGDVGTFISGSGVGNEFIYKYHIFTPSASADEATNRSYQDFTISSGFSDDFEMLVIGPGGPGNRATGSATGNRYVAFGGGGGAGQLVTQSLSGLCDAYGTFKIAPGWPMPWGSTTLQPDLWQSSYGQTIVSSSTGILYQSAGIGGRGSGFGVTGGEDGNYTGLTNWTDRSGSNGGGSSFRNPGGYASGSYSTLSTFGGNGWSGSVGNETGSAGGGGGAGENGFDGTQGATAEGGEGGDGLRFNMDGTLRYYAGGGAGYGPGGAGNGGVGGGGDSGYQFSTGSFYGAGGGAWLGDRVDSYTTPWGTTYPRNGLGGDGAVIIKYKWKENDKPNNFITTRGLAQYYDMYDLDSYDGTGSLVYNVWKNDNTASLENITGWEFDTDNLGSGSLLIVTASVNPYVEPDTETTNQLTLLTVWEVNNQVYQSDGLLPILTDETFGTSSIGIYGGNDELYGEAVVIKIGDTLVTTESGSAGGFIPRGGFHISQFSYDQSTNELLWYVDGVSGSATVNETIDGQPLLFNFNSSSDASAGLGNNSVYNITTIYTASLAWDEMRHNDDILYPRY